MIVAYKCDCEVNVQVYPISPFKSRTALSYHLYPVENIKNGSLVRKIKDIQVISILKTLKMEH
jgi:hypothetical protein